MNLTQYRASLWIIKNEKTYKIYVIRAVVFLFDYKKKDHPCYWVDTVKFNNNITTF